MESERILGQNHILRHFENAIRMGKISHAYIINGEEGSGKMNLAIHFAKALQCERNNSNKAINEDGERITVPGTACGQCKSCKQTDSKNQPDIKYITYEKSGIGVDEIREQINDDIDIKPYSSPYKIYIVPESEKMTVQAQNALLKTIEEPPAYGIVIFLTTNADIFLQTIISRCVLLDLKPLKESVVMDYLKDNYDVSEYERKFAADFAQGKIGRAKTIIEGTEFAHLKNNVMHVIKNVKDMTAADIMAVVKDVTNYKLTIDDYLDLMAMWFRDVLMFKSTNDTNYLIFSDEISLIKSQAEVMSYEGIQDILNSIDKVKVRLKANVNFDLCIELLIMAMKEDM